MKIYLIRTYFWLHKPFVKSQETCKIRFPHLAAYGPKEIEYLQASFGARVVWKIHRPLFAPVHPACFGQVRHSATENVGAELVLVQRRVANYVLDGILR